jgi:hypothetical protein
MDITLIYLVTNCFDDPNKVYIGKTKNTRKSAHKRTYGDNIEYSYIDEIESLDRKDWEPLETYWIEQFKAWGFEVVNIKKKGGGGPSYCTEETKQKISKANSKPKPEGFGDKLSLTTKGKPKPEGFSDKLSLAAMGKPKPEGFGDKISESLKGRPKPKGWGGGKPRTGPNKGMRCRVGQVDKVTNEIIAIFNNQVEAALSMGKRSGNASISECCNGRRKSIWGYKWVWVLEE